MSKWLYGIILRSSPNPIINAFCSRSFSRSSYLYSHYDTLQLNPSASLKEVKDAYFKLSKKYHPDLHPNDPKCHERFIELQEAYKILSNPDSRRQYDTKMRTRPSPKYQRPYAYPDFTQRDEWLKQEEMRREHHFRQEFGSPRNTEEFNRFYSRPHKMTPEELEGWYRYKKFIRDDRFLYWLFGAVLVAAVCEAVFVSSNTDRHMLQKFTKHSGFNARSFFDPPSEEEIRILENQIRRDEIYRIMRSRDIENEQSNRDRWNQQNIHDTKRES